MFAVFETCFMFGSCTQKLRTTAPAQNTQERPFSKKLKYIIGIFTFGGAG